jgi:hypothetical protein
MRRLLVLAAVAALFLVVLPVAPVGAGSPFRDVKIEVDTTLGEPSNGPFTATGDAVTEGLICESGWTVDLSERFAPREGSPAGINVKAVKAFYCGFDGFPGELGDPDFVVRMQIRIDKNGERDKFNWVAIDGVKGNGHGSGVFAPPSVKDTLTGKVR